MMSCSIDEQLYNNDFLSSLQEWLQSLVDQSTYCHLIYDCNQLMEDIQGLLVYPKPPKKTERQVVFVTEWRKKASAMATIAHMKRKRRSRMMATKRKPDAKIDQARRIARLQERAKDFDRYIQTRGRAPFTENKRLNRKIKRASTFPKILYQLSLIVEAQESLLEEIPHSRLQVLDPSSHDLALIPSIEGVEENAYNSGGIPTEGDAQIEADVHNETPSAAPETTRRLISCCIEDMDADNNTVRIRPALE
jgi:hypothetical protein